MFARRPIPERKPLAFPAPITAGNFARCDGGAVARPKDAPVRSEAYRRLVAALDCVNCGIGNYSQAAHPPPTGKGIKECDLKCFPLCCTRPGIPGCHAMFDQYKLIPRDLMDEYALDWGAETRATIINNGDWPKGLPLMGIA